VANLPESRGTGIPGSIEAFGSHDKRSYALGRRPSIIVRMAELKIVCSQHEDDERQWRIDLVRVRAPQVRSDLV